VVPLTSVTGAASVTAASVAVSPVPAATVAAVEVFTRGIPDGDRLINAAEATPEAASGADFGLLAYSMSTC
jgi:hypothetical protein